MSKVYGGKFSDSLIVKPIDPIYIKICTPFSKQNPMLSYFSNIA